MVARSVADTDSGVAIPLVSVVIPTYNRSALLRRTLESLTLQALPAAQFEVIVADDGSSDDTCSVVSLRRSAPGPISLPARRRFPRGHGA